MSDRMVKIQTEVVDHGLCSVCGSCIGVCPTQCISVNAEVNSIEIDYNKCVSCNICGKVCPTLNTVLSVSAKENTSKYSKDIGSYEYVFRGCASDSDTRKNGASGGMVTALCKFFLNEGFADRIVCAGFSDKNGFYRIVDKAEDLMTSQKSFYIPIPIGAAMKRMKNSGLRYVVVGTPCQLQGFSRAIEGGLLTRCQIVAKLGLLCGYVQERSSVDYLAKMLGCSGGDWEFLGWRCGEYPGSATFKNKIDGKVKKMGYYDFLAVCVPFFSIKKCLLCPDGSNETADISFGDVHGFGKDMNIGILRSSHMDQYLKMAQEKGYIDFDTDDQEMLYTNASMVSGSKRRVVLEQLILREKSGKAIPRYTGIELKSENNFIMRFFQAKKARLMEKYSDKAEREKILRCNPQKMLKKGRYIYQYPSSSKAFKFICKVVSVIKK